MSLTNCPECSKSISSNATLCPGCGYKPRKAFSIASTISFLACVIVMIILIRFGRHVDWGASSPIGIPISEKQRLARERLGKLCVPYSVESFVERVRERDYLAVQLFAKAGLSPTKKNAAGESAMKTAIDSGDAGLTALSNEWMKESAS